MSLKFKKTAIYLALALSPLSAVAALGGNAQSIEQDFSALRGHGAASSVQGKKDATQQATQQTVDASPSGRNYQVKKFITKNGTEVREYLHKDVVFGVAWTGPVIPDLRQLFGFANYTTYRNALQSQDPVQRSRRVSSISTSTLVVDSFGKVPHFSGQAYIPQRVPAGVAISDIQ
ncbi:hypothetical protein CXB49_09300 [Chromobacterium sp. ATCC 53434]|uniref:DUF2844 domain-containing protein n=1 Tax=Chromobacterium TaxID=535 RepID=UPI000C76EBD8|nr:DUF2844 domain-containing protein [Chromobacterium sp. ATCC 53434]AUH50992.1 hypothetical protein CXB49_09300 [Chromobacterium sp. ATCC 53434]